MEQKPFCLADFDVIGFDLDNTVAKYNIDQLYGLTYKSLSDVLVKEKCYSDDSLGNIETEAGFCMKGLILDLQHGNVLKLSEVGVILRASHGMRTMTDEQIGAVYGTSRKLEKFDELRTTINSTDSYKIVDTFFDNPATLLFARLVDLLDSKGDDGVKTYHRCWQEIIYSFTHNFRHRDTAQSSGYFFGTLTSDRGRYLRHCSEKLKAWMKSLRESGKIVFLMTQSFPDYTVMILEQVLGPDWHDYFDLILCYARKPSFFENVRPFIKLDSHKETTPVTELKRGEMYSQGRFDHLMEALRQMTQRSEPQIVYIGDSFRSDVFPQKSLAGWSTVLILEELEAEGYTLADASAEKCAGDSDQHDVKKPKLQRTKFISDADKTSITSEKWGSLFYDGNMSNEDTDNQHSSSRRMNTFWGWFISKYVDIAVPSLEYFVDFPLKHKFTCFSGLAGDISGFHPGPPVSVSRSSS